MDLNSGIEVLASELLVLLFLISSCQLLTYKTRLVSFTLVNWHLIVVRLSRDFTGENMFLQTSSWSDAVFPHKLVEKAAKRKMTWRMDFLNLKH